MFSPLCTAFKMFSFSLLLTLEVVSEDRTWLGMVLPTPQNHQSCYLLSKYRVNFFHLVWAHWLAKDTSPHGKQLEGRKEEILKSMQLWQNKMDDRVILISLRRYHQGKKKKMWALWQKHFGVLSMETQIRFCFVSCWTETTETETKDARASDSKLFWLRVNSAICLPPPQCSWALCITDSVKKKKACHIASHYWQRQLCRMELVRQVGLSQLVSDRGQLADGEWD